MASVFITGGAGFVGSSLARKWKEEFPSDRVTVLDNLHRRGGELNLATFQKLGIEFVHGDIRCPEDFEQVKGEFDVFIEASAEPSVLAGLNGGHRYLLQTNLMGTLHCLEFARKNCQNLIFLSTSRVYSIPAMIDLPLKEKETRFELDPKGFEQYSGLSQKGIAENFSTEKFRSLYGATKLASELFVQEYTANFKLPTVINRCGVLAGPGQWGKVDQGVFTFWVARHFFKQPLKYTGFGGEGKQVRDLLHVQDLYDLIKLQVKGGKIAEDVQGQIYNIGGGLEVSTSMLELTQICQKVTGNKVEIEKIKQTATVDIPYYVTDFSKAQARFNWVPRKSVQDIVSDIHVWLRENETLLKPLFS